MTAVEGLFRDTFGFCPTLLVRAPGRVNLIGEHIPSNDQNCIVRCIILPVKIKCIAEA